MKQRASAVLFLVLIGVLLSAGWLKAADPVVENVDFIEADMRDVFRSLGMAGQYNVILTKEVQGSVTLSLRQGMTVRQAIELIARTYDFDLRWQNERTVVIGRTATLKTNFDLNYKETKVFTLHYSTVNEIAEALKVVGSLQMSLNPRTNQITVVASPLELENVQEIIAQLDHPMPQVNIELRVEEIDQSTLQEIGLDWLLTGSVGIAPGTAIVATAQANATLKALENKGKATLLSQPNISCLDSQPGKIFIGRSEPVGQEITDSTGKTTWNISFIDIGTTLTIEPRVNLNNVVTVKVKADISSANDFRTIGGVDYPIVVRRTTESIVRLRDGQTFVLGGLIQRMENTSTRGVPFLSRIPVIGMLFGVRKNEVKENRVMYIFMTTHVGQVKPEETVSGGPGMIRVELPSGGGKAAETSIVPAPAPPSSPPRREPDAAAQEDAGKSVINPPPVVETPASVVETPAPSAESPDLTGPSVEELAGMANPAPPAAPIDLPAAASSQGATEGPMEQAVTPPPPATPQSGPNEPVPAVRDNNLPAVTPAPTLPRPEEIKHVSYTVKKGESLASIGRKFGVPYREIARYNGLSPNASLQVGQVLLVPIPDDHKYVVKPKETLWRIAKRYGVTVELLMELNGLADGTKIEVGQVIILPCSVNQIANKEY